MFLRLRQSTLQENMWLEYRIGVRSTGPRARKSLRSGSFSNGLGCCRPIAQLRAYLARQQDHKRIKGAIDKIIQLRQLPDGFDELDCARAEFVSESRLEFTIRMERRLPGWRISQFRFHLYLPGRREVTMVRIHLNAQQGRDY